jgi:negative elongation factor C/D
LSEIEFKTHLIRILYSEINVLKKKLYKLYSSEDPPPLYLIRNSRFLDMLISYFFEPTSKPNPEHKEKYSYLLAAASSVSETFDEDGQQRVSLDKNELEHTRTLIDNAFTICHENKGSSDLLADLNELFRCFTYKKSST